MTADGSSLRERRERMRRRTRRNRVLAASAVVIVAGGVTVALLAPSSPAPRRAQATPARASHPTRRTASSPEAGVAGLPSAAAQEAAMSRVARLGYPLYRAGGHAGRVAALTFDDGPGPDTLKVISTLRGYGDRATFFLVGRNIANWPAVPRRESAEGAVGDHTWNHPYLPKLAASAVRTEITRTQVAAAAASGGPVHLFRPPYGAHDRSIDAFLRSRGMVEVLWDVDSRDSEGASAEQMVRTVLSDIRPGSIVLMHENRGQTMKALNRILPALRRRHWKLVSVPELLAMDPPTATQLRAGWTRPSPASG